MSDPVIYRYRDRRGRLLFSVVRHLPKRFELFDAAGRQIPKFPDRTVLYRLPELLAADKAATVFVTEGEKDVDRLAARKLVATTNPGGCRLVLTTVENGGAGKKLRRLKMVARMCVCW